MLGWSGGALKFYQAVQVAAEVFAFGEGRTCFVLHSCLTFSNIEKTREGAVNISVDVGPLLRVKDWIALADLADDNPVDEFSNIAVFFVGVLGVGRCGFETNGAHVVVIAVINIGLLFVFQSITQLIQTRFTILAKSLILAVQFERNSGLSMHTKELIEE